MNKKLILLILGLPLILMLSLFSVSNTVSISVSIPVSKIEIIGDRFVYLNLDAEEDYVVDYTVYPTNAKNKNVYIETEQVGTSDLAEIEYVDGKIVAKSTGKAKVYLTTVDGGFRDSFIVHVTSNKLKSISCELEQTSIYVGDTTSINTTFVPEELSNSILKYEVDDEFKHIVSVSAAGVVTGVSKGIAEITIISAIDETIKDTVQIEIKNKDILDLETSQLVTWNKTGSVNVSLDTEEDCDFALEILNNDITDSIFKAELNLTNLALGRISIDYEFVNINYTEPVIVKVSATTESGLVVSKTCEISIVNQIQAEFLSKELIQVKVEEPIGEIFTVTPANSEVECEPYASNDNVEVSIYEGNNILAITGKKLGSVQVGVKVYNKLNREEFVTITKEIVVVPVGIGINESAVSYGIENVFAFAKTEVDGSISSCQLSLATGGNQVGENFMENISWFSNSNNASIDNNGKITLSGESGSELVEFKAVYSYKGITIESDPFKINCVYDGVNVRSYLDLWNATNEQNPKPIVVQNDIEKDFGVGVDQCYKLITTTYDNTYYRNIGKLDAAKIKVLIEFKNDVYGNGKTINAHNIAWEKNLQNATTNAIFTGPLNFVAMSETGGMVSVKAQDNVCFAVYEDVTLSNIVLKGCNLQADQNNEYDLADLTYTGTTVEVFGDNVNIQYSRISNGRTVLRAFGDIEDSSKVINLNIKNSILSGSREFILRLGTNSFVDGTKENPSPYLPNDEIQTFPMQKAYGALGTMTEQEKLAYDEQFIKTFVTVKNSVFRDAGIFAIGLDSHFAGAALADGSSYLGGLVKDWYDLAKTSYGVKLTFEEDVKMYNWKKLSDVDSSTLIEILGESQFADLEFDVAEMVDTISKNEKFSSITYTDEKTGTKYVHAGIAFFGGGKNYSVFEDNRDYNNKDYETHVLNEYEISLADVNKATLQAAAGKEKFFFMLNDATTKNFLPENQEQILANEKEANACIYR